MSKPISLILILSMSLSLQGYAASKKKTPPKKDAECSELLETQGSTKKGQARSGTIYSRTFNIDTQKPHTPRLISEEFSLTRVRRDLRALTGLSPIDCEGTCIPGRFDEQQKELVRNFILEKLDEVGLEGEVQEFVYERYVKKPRSSYRSGAPGIDPTKASYKELRKVWESYAFIDLRKYLVNSKKMRDNAEVLKTLDIDYFKKLITELIDAKKAVEELQKDENITDDEDLELHEEITYYDYALYDARKYLDALAEGQKKKSKPKKKEKEEVIEKRLHNVVVEIQGTKYPDEVIELNAHYDTTADDLPGADDNGSGVTTLLEVARILSTYKPKRTVRLVFADLEEEGFKGTIQHVHTLADKDETFLGALVIDTIGYAPVGPQYPAVPPFVVEAGTKKDHEEKSFKKVQVLVEAMAYQFAMYNDRYVMLDIETDGALPGTADHGPYWRDSNPAVLIAAPYEGDMINPGYHNEGDIIEQYNWGYFEGVAKFIIESVVLAAEVTPTAAQYKSLQSDSELMSLLDDTFANPSSQRLRFPKPKPKPTPKPKKKSNSNGNQKPSSFFSSAVNSMLGTDSDESSDGGDDLDDGDWMNRWDDTDQ